jgi:hypothetical protein
MQGVRGRAMQLSTGSNIWVLFYKIRYSKTGAVI